MQQAPYIHFDEAGIFAGKGIAFFDDPIAGEPNQPLPPQPAPVFPDDAQACTQEQYDAAGAWTVFRSGLIVVGTPPIASPADLAQAALAAGIAVTSATVSAINGIYSCDADTLTNIQAEMIALLDNGTFTNDTAALAWPDIVGAFHDFNPTQFRAYARAVAKFVGGCKTIIIAGAGLVPAATAELP